VCQKDALIIAVTAVFFVSFFLSNHWNGIFRALGTSRRCSLTDVALEMLVKAGWISG
jgi:hypothetical protein